MLSFHLLLFNQAYRKTLKKRFSGIRECVYVVSERNDSCIHHAEPSSRTLRFTLFLAHIASHVQRRSAPCPATQQYQSIRSLCQVRYG